MAHCVVSAIYDTDVDALVPACVVHAHYAPCPRNGAPASGTPLHSDDHAGEEAAVAYWTQVTGRQRPFVVHHGSIADPEHNTEGWDCPCLPSHYTAKEA